MPTQKFFDHFENKDDYVVANELKQNMTKKECKKKACAKATKTAEKPAKKATAKAKK